MSQVSAMISATLSNVVDIIPALFGHGEDGRRPGPAHASPPVPGPLGTRTPRIAKDAGKFNGGRPAARSRRCLEISPCAGNRIAVGTAAAFALFQAAIGANIAPATASAGLHRNTGGHGRELMLYACRLAGLVALAVALVPSSAAVAQVLMPRDVS